MEECFAKSLPGVSPQVNRLVCHCATDGSTITIEALNSVGAGIGDRVSVSRDASALVKNAAVLIGIPLMGIIVGIVIAAILTHGFTSHIIGGTLTIAACLSLGIVLGVSVFRRVPAGSQPAIEHIIERRRQGDFLFK
ncbi:MAG TPA: hypothetical protein DDW42_02360 [Desulfobacteraceae bacterium]|nr:hypothetical protein [Desulfobacteraceae bacterium]